MAKEVKRIVEKHFGKEIEVIYQKGTPGKTIEEIEEARKNGTVIHIFNFCPKLDPCTFEPEPGITCHRDMSMQLRDGVRIYFDLYLPTEAEKNNTPVPLIISWSMFGKRQSEGMQDWKLMGVPPGTVSKMAKFESPDPGYWCRNGYAVANVDVRGVGNSEGNVSPFGPQDGQDGYDFIEWAAQQPWCNGKVGITGNSGVGMPIWHIAATQPPHLACIAPWEATSDLYRESICSGGIPSPDFYRDIANNVACKTWIEDIAAMFDEHPFIDEYWMSKIAPFDKIRIPAYVTAGWCHFHLRGSVEGFRRIRSTKKWLRIHRDFEWPDTYHYQNLEELKRFFDRYLKDIRNGWEFTPRVRIDVMDGYEFDYAVRRPEEKFPLERTQYRKLYLDAATRTAALDQPFANKAEVSYDPKTEVTYFDYKFTEETEITGYMKLRLWVECRGNDDMDMFIWIKKLGLNGEYVPVKCMDGFYRGAWGYMRASRRELDEKLSTDFQPVQAHKSEKKLKPGEVVPVDIEIWPHSRVWHKGESLRVEVGGRFIRTDWYEDAKIGFDSIEEGTHVIHTGGEYDSYLQIPIVPPKYQVGDYIYRG